MNNKKPDGYLTMQRVYFFLVGKKYYDDHGAVKS